MYKTPLGARFIVASDYCSTKSLSNTTPKLFKMIFNAVESFHHQSLCIQAVRHSGVYKILFQLNKINVKKKAESISAFEFSILYITIPDKLLLKLLSEVVNFAFKSEVRKRIGLSKKYIYWTSKELEEDASLNKLLSTDKCFFTLLLTWFLNKILVYQCELNQHHFGRTSLFNSLNLIM